jgi:hypothetical protein
VTELRSRPTEGWIGVTEGWIGVTELRSRPTEGWIGVTEGWIEVTELRSRPTEGWIGVTEGWIGVDDLRIGGACPISCVTSLPGQDVVYTSDRDGGSRVGGPIGDAESDTEGGHRAPNPIQRLAPHRSSASVFGVGPRPPEGAAAMPRAESDGGWPMPRPTPTPKPMADTEHRIRFGCFRIGPRHRWSASALGIGVGVRVGIRVGVGVDT